MSQETTKFTVTENKEYSISELKQRIASIDATVATHLAKRQELVDIISSMVDAHSLDIVMPEAMELKSTNIAKL